ncbi:hypothetical protein Taro_033493 [Colocasia esculenta]|uniref:Uncharacterized protein n=1 Tax=Colocasia esculenta TaxID=4460 RepID=A0A843VTZ2_COLES|nr:hypothetical protein [Colocasia esculenta]
MLCGVAVVVVVFLYGGGPHTNSSRGAVRPRTVIVCPVLTATVISYAHLTLGDDVSSAAQSRHSFTKIINLVLQRPGSPALAGRLRHPPHVITARVGPGAQPIKLLFNPFGHAAPKQSSADTNASRTQALPGLPGSETVGSLIPPHAPHIRPRHHPCSHARCTHTHTTRTHHSPVPQQNPEALSESSLSLSLWTLGGAGWKRPSSLTPPRSRLAGAVQICSLPPFRQPFLGEFPSPFPHLTSQTCFLPAEAPGAFFRRGLASLHLESAPPGLLSGPTIALSALYLLCFFCNPADPAGICFFSTPAVGTPSRTREEEEQEEEEARSDREIATSLTRMETAPPVAPTLATARAAQTLTLAAGLLLAAATATVAVVAEERFGSKNERGGTSHANTPVEPSEAGEDGDEDDDDNEEDGDFDEGEEELSEEDGKGYEEPNKNGGKGGSGGAGEENGNGDEAEDQEEGDDDDEDDEPGDDDDDDGSDDEEEVADEEEEEEEDPEEEDDEEDLHPPKKRKK